MSLMFSGQGSGTPVQVLVGRGAPTFNLSRYIDLDGGGLRVEETGNNVDDTASWEVVDFLRVIDEIQPEAQVLIKEGPKIKFRGFIRTFEPTAETVHNRVTVTAVGIGSILDKCIIPTAGGTAYVRSKKESDRARILWLLKTFGQPFLVHASNDFSKVQVLEPRMEKQDFSSLTLRQAIEQVLAVASESANYYIDQAGRLHTFDEDTDEGLIAPYDVVQAHLLSSSEAPVANFRVLWDTSELINYYYVRGKNKAGSGAFSNAASIARYGRRQAFLDGPDSDTRRKARRLARAALKDTKDPLPRISFTVSDEYATRAGKDWSPGQKATMTSPSTGWLKNVDRILRVTTTYLSSAGIKRVDIEVGALRRLFGYGGYPGAPYGYDPKRPVIDIDWDPPELDPGDPILPPPPIPPTVVDPTHHVFDHFAEPLVFTPGFSQPMKVPLIGEGGRTGGGWDGDNTWSVFLSVAAASGGVFVGSHSSLFVESDVNLSTVMSLSVSSQGEPPLPFDPATVHSGPWEIEGRYRLSGAATNVLGTGQRFVRIGWAFRGDLILRFGDPTHPYTAIAIVGETSPMLQKPITPQGSWGLFRLRWDDGIVYVREWEENTPMPDWQLQDEVGADIVDTDTSLDITVRVGNNSGGTSQRFDLDYIKVVTPDPSPGYTVEDTQSGDGTTTTFLVQYPIYSITEIRVDGVQVGNAVIDNLEKTVTFDRAPSDGAVVSIVYIVGATDA